MVDEIRVQDGMHKRESCGVVTYMTLWVHSRAWHSFARICQYVARIMVHSFSLYTQPFLEQQHKDLSEGSRYIYKKYSTSVWWFFFCKKFGTPWDVIMECTSLPASIRWTYSAANNLCSLSRFTNLAYSLTPITISGRNAGGTDGVGCSEPCLHYVLKILSG